MPKKSAKKDKNIYFQRREDLDLTREKASELMETMTPERLEKIENEQCLPRPDEVLLMAKKYGYPELSNYFCSNQCEIGREYVPEITIQNLAQLILQMISCLNSVEKKKDRLIDITADGKIDDNEIDDFIDIQEKLDHISVAVKALQLWTEKKQSDGTIDMDKYHQRKAQRC